jgi:hypothetical protein
MLTCCLLAPIWVLSLWGSYCCVMYTFTSQLYQRSQLRICWRYFLFSLFSTCFGPYGPSSGEIRLHHLILMFFSKDVSDVIVFHLKMARRGRNMLWTERIKSNTNKFSVAIADIFERYTHMGVSGSSLRSKCVTILNEIMDLLTIVSPSTAVVTFIKTAYLYELIGTWNLYFFLRY